MEEKFTTKEALVQKAKELAESENLVSAFNQLKGLRKQWRRLEGDEESLYDKEMADQFYGYVDSITAKQSELSVSVEEAKKDIINRAKEVLNEGNFKKATNMMNDLMDQWKGTGRSNNETDNDLWAQFKEVRDEFFAKRKAYYENLTEEFNKNKEAKQEMIAKIKEVAQIENVKNMISELDSLMAEWKQIGSAGRAKDEELWAEFNTERKAIYAKRNAYFDGLKEMYNQRAEAKKEIIAEARKCLARSEFTDEEVETMKGFRAKWKEVGNAGKENEDALWEEFNGVLNKYFENLRAYR